MTIMVEQKGNIGYLIKKMREKQGISQSELCRGLCSNVALYRIENGERDVEISLAARFFQRLGYSSDKFELYGGAEEFQRYEMQQTIRLHREKHQFGQMEELLNVYEKMYSEERSGVGLQFLLSNRGVLEIQKKNYSAGISLMEHAISCTVPDWEKESWSQWILGEDELDLFVFLADAHEDKGEKEAAFQIREGILKYLDQKRVSKEQVVKLYTRTICGMTPYLLEEGHNRKCLSLCECGLTILAETKWLSCWPELLYWKGKSQEALWKSGEEKIEEKQIIGSFQRAYYIFRLLNNPEMAEKTKECLEVYGWESIRLEK